jgi:putative DNA primase/helicase
VPEFEEVITWFDVRSRNADGTHMAICPAHDDNGPSLSIKKGDDGRTLLHCFHGCDAKRIMESIGKELADLFPGELSDYVRSKYGRAGKKPKASTTVRSKGKVFATDDEALEHLKGYMKRDPVASYVYEDARRNRVMVQLRFDTPEGKEFRPISLGPDGWVLAGMPAPRILYRLPEILERPDEVIYVCEGEKAANAVRNLGLLATTSPNGSQSAKKTDWSPAAGRTLVITRDNDAPGEKFAYDAAELCAQAKAKSVRIHLLPRLPAHGDAFDYIELLRSEGKSDEEIRTEFVAECEKGKPFGLKIDEYEYTDVGNAQRMASMFAEDMKYCPQKGWYFWMGTHWKRDSTKEAHRRAVRVTEWMKEKALELGEREGKDLLDHAIRSQAIGRINAMVEAGTFLKEFAVDVSVFDANKDLLNVANGTIDLKTSTLRPHNKEDYITHVSSVAYDPNARHPLVDKFLEDVTQGDPELLAFVLRAAGYSLTGHTREEAFFIVHGKAGSGKSTFIEAMRVISGDLARTANFEVFLTTPMGNNSGVQPELARLHGARLVSSIEVDEGRKLAVSVVKSVTGRDQITCRELYCKSFEYKPEWKLWLVCNHAPVVDDRDDAMWRRIYKVPFNAGIPRAKQDQSVKDRITGDPQVLSAFLTRVVEGARDWYEKGLCPPEAVKIATEEYREEMDPLKEFIEEEVVFGSGFEMRAAKLREMYTEWCRDQGVKNPMNRKKFNDRLKSLGIESVHREDGAYWAGVAPRPPDWHADIASAAQGGY